MLIKVFMEAVEDNSLPLSFTEAVISLILKRDKEKITKILSKILALRAEKIIPIIIYSDQTGFVKNRNPLGNIR